MACRVWARRSARLTLGVLLSSVVWLLPAEAQNPYQQPYQQGAGNVQAPPAGQPYQNAAPANFYKQGNAGQTNAQVDQNRAQAIVGWFQRYDQVRRQAQMSPQERSKADSLLSKGIAMFIPGEEKVAAQKLLTQLVGTYAQACDAMKALPLYPETEKLHRGYYQYFSTANQLFSDYLAVQKNPLAQDAQGNPLAAGFLGRKQNLEALDQSNKALDAQIRAQWGIPAYRY